MINIIYDSNQITRDYYKFINSTIIETQFSKTLPVVAQMNALNTSALIIDSDKGNNVETNVNHAISDDDPLTVEELMDIDESLIDLEAGRYLVISEEMSGKDIVKKMLEFGKNE